MEKDGEAAGARKGSDVQIRAVLHLFNLWVVGNVTLSVTASYGTCTTQNVDHLWETGATGRQFSFNSHRSAPSHVGLACRRYYFLEEQTLQAERG